jgi:hypothetical protein
MSRGAGARLTIAAVTAVLVPLVALVAGGCAIRPPRFVVVDPATLAARNDDHWIIRAVPAADAGAQVDGSVLE